MIDTKENTILKTIIDLSEKLHGCALEESILEAEKENLSRLAAYLNIDEMSALFFTVIFYIQNQDSSASSLADIADFLEYPHIAILMYTSNLSQLQKKYLIEQRKAESRFGRRTERNAGYEIPETVMDCIIENTPLVPIEETVESSDKIFRKIFSLFMNCIKNSSGSEDLYRTISSIERKYADNEIIKNIVKEFPEELESRIILYMLSASVITDKSLADDESDFFYDILGMFIQYGRCKRLENLDDVLFERNLIVKNFELVSNDMRRGNCYANILKLSQEGLKKLFGSEAEKYISDGYEKSELELTMDALHEFGTCYEKRRSLTIKRRELLTLEDKFKELPFFKAVKKTKLENTYRFFLYDCAKDFIDGNESSLCSTLSDLFGKSNSYFTYLRTMLDEKDPLNSKGYVEIEKNEVVERTSVTLSDRSIELLYGKNADLYKKKTILSKDILEPEKLKEKTLFYSDKVQKQIDMLEESLSQKNLVAMQKRLEAKGLPKGVAVLLYGAPGTGKTETVYQLAKRTNRKILHVDISESKSMWFGESEKIIKKIFTNYRKLCKNAERHKENTPILLFNEADALISKRRDVTSGNCAQTENAMQNILLEEIEKLDGIIFATTNLCENMDKAFERRFLFKVEYEKPSLDARKKIWGTKLPELEDKDLEKLADRFDFSGGEIDNIVRKCEMTEIIKGKLPSFTEITELCENERLEKEERECHMGFCLD